MASTSTKVMHGIGVVLAVLAMVGLIVSSLPLTLFTRSTPPPVKTTSDFPADFSFEVASTPEAREQGLSGRADVAPNYGMLFVFDEPGSYSFWMKDMLVPIDMIWLAEDGSIVDIDHSVSPDTYPQMFSAASPVLYVLETKAGESERLTLEIGDTIPLPVL